MPMDKFVRIGPIETNNPYIIMYKRKIIWAMLVLLSLPSMAQTKKEHNVPYLRVQKY